MPLLVDSARGSGLRVELRSLPATEELTGTVELTAYRIVQEALLNACKHAPNCAATLTITHDGSSLLVELRNDLPLGTGPASVAETGGGRGLVTMRERAEAVGGRLTGGPDGDGWLVRAALPRLA
ncbi:sensor histidine kinase [Pseudonocardia sp. ICBG1293]|uniref:sensor histidine kinase n=1 Tax=Pseudonocardia sp. ICBG1293 TaxID=2844382 RepID=UPI001CCC7E80|nr:hypothetical protein [Pseudonocardia sp. ICBG1293]